MLEDDEPFDDELVDEESDDPPDELEAESELPDEDELDSDELVLSAGLVLVDDPFLDSLERLSVR